MKHIKQLKHDINKTYLQLDRYLRNTVDKHYDLYTSNIPEVFQWGPIARIIFAYQLNTNVQHNMITAEVENMKNNAVQLAEYRGLENLKNITQQNFEHLRFIVMSELAEDSLANNMAFVSENDVLTSIVDIICNPKLSKLHDDNRKKHNYDMVAKSLRYIQTIGSDVISTPDTRKDNIEFKLEELNKINGLEYSREKYAELLDNEKNPKIIDIITRYKYDKSL